MCVHMLKTAQEERTEPFSSPDDGIEFYFSRTPVIGHTHIHLRDYVMAQGHSISITAVQALIVTG